MWNAERARQRLLDRLPKMGEGRILAPAEYQRHAAVLVPFYENQGRTSILFTERTQNLPSHKGQISFPGGGADATDVDLEMTALRETHEEIGLPPAEVEILGQLDDIVTVTDYVISPYVGWIPGVEELKPDPGEVARFHEVFLDDLLRPEIYERKDDYEFRGRPYPVHFFRLEGVTIWGATGKMLAQLLKDVFDWHGEVGDYLS